MRSEFILFVSEFITTRVRNLFLASGLEATNTAESFQVEWEIEGTSFSVVCRFLNLDQAR